MRFALLGGQSDGQELARALVRSGRHELVAYAGPGGLAAATEFLSQLGLGGRAVADVEEVLADPAVEAVIVAGRLPERPALLRRALQSERHVLCVHPPDETPDVAYEAALIQGDTRRVLLPLLTAPFHPGIRLLAELLRAEGGVARFRLLELERWSPEPLVSEADRGAWNRPTFPDWQVLRLVGGEVAEVSAFAAREEVAPDDPVLLAGRFERGPLFRVTVVPGQPEQRWQLRAVGGPLRAELTLPAGWPGPARLTWQAADGTRHEEDWPAWDPWPRLVEVFEAAVAAGPSARTAATEPSWQDTIRCLELDDAARRSVERRRAHTLEYPEASEEVGFKGAMTLVGCGVLWGTLFLLVLSRWVPWLGWAIAPVLVGFLVLQLLRWVIPGNKPAPRG